MRKRSEIEDSWKLHHDNAFILSHYLVRVNIPVFPQPLYSSDLSPPDFFLFSRLKSALKGNHYDTIEDIQAKFKAALADIPEQAYVNAFTAWKSRLQKFVDVGDAYFGPSGSFQDSSKGWFGGEG